MTTKAKNPIGTVELTDLLEAGVHFGHQAKRWNPRMAPYIWQDRGGIHVFDLLKTRECLQAACETAKKMAEEGKVIVFVGTKRQAQEIIKEEAKRCGMPYIDNRWAGGLLTNWSQVSKSIEKLVKLREGQEKGEFKHLTKKERVLIDRRIAQLERLLGGLVELKKIPDALFVVDTRREETAVLEALKVGIKVFGVVDTNVNPEPIDYPIPANDDAVRSIKLVVGTFASAIAEGKAAGEKKGQK
jgi:small subunit ribosomal protein S2